MLDEGRRESIVLFVQANSLDANCLFFQLQYQLFDCQIFKKFIYDPHVIGLQV